MAANILERIRSAENLPSLPTVAIEVLRLTSDERAPITELATVIQHDPALTARILKVVNSPLFGVAQAVTSISQAMNLLGARTVRVMALSFSLVDAISRDKGGSFDFERYWRHSVTCSVAARLLAKAADSRFSEESFIAALLSNIGRLAAVRCAPDQYLPALEEANRRAVQSQIVEKEMLGVTHAEMGRVLLTGWGLPDSLCAAVGAHHGDGLDALTGEAAEIARFVYFGTLIAAVFCLDIPTTELDRIKAECKGRTGVGGDALERLLTDLDGQVRSTASLLSLQIGQTHDYTTLRAQASEQLSRLSMQAEVERIASARKEEDARRVATRLTEENRAILEVAATDGLTGLANRAAFDGRLTEEIERARAARSPLALVMLDIDHFKAVNDSRGHPAGDAVLRLVGRILREEVASKGFAARYGGEEFAVILPGHAVAPATRFADSLRRRIEIAVIRHEGAALRITASLGVACHDKGDTPESLVAGADRCLYAAKRSGRNRVCSDAAGAKLVA